MTRLEIVESFDEETKAKFINNCGDLNNFMAYEWWLNRTIATEDNQNISGAFAWGRSPEGHDFWSDINEQILNK